MREILRAATLGSAQLDDCFEKLSKEGRLDGPFARYVEELEQQQKAKPGDGLLDRVLVIVRDRVKAEGGASKELRVLARALRCSDEAETCVEIKFGCTKSFLGDDATVLAPSSGERPTPPRHRASVASTACRATDDAATATDGTG